MSVNQRSTFGRDEQVAAIVGAILGSIPAGLLLWGFGGADSIRRFAWFVGAGSLGAGWAVWFGLAILFGLAFGVAMSRTVNSFTNTVIMVSQKSELTQRVLVPMLHRSALGLTAGSMGLIYGQVLGFGFFEYLMPVVLALNGHFVEYPLADFPAIVAYIVYATILGTAYGLLLEAGWFAPAETLGKSDGVSPEQAAGFVASQAAGLLAALLVGAFVGLRAFRGLAQLVGLSGAGTGFLVWMVLMAILGAAFVAIVSRTINDFTNTVIMFSRRSTATQKILVPLITRAALTVTAGSMGIVYGLVVGVLYWAVSLSPVLPTLSGLIVPIFGLFGYLLGTLYGLQLEEVDLSLPAVGPLGREVDVEAEVVEAEEASDSEVPGGFAGWRATRPFAGAVMLILAGLIIAAVPIRLQMIFPGPSKAALGIVFGAMVVACGVFALVKPELSTLIGVTAVAMSILSIIGAFGGLVVGMLVGIVGGNLCIAWQNPYVDEQARSGSRFRWIGEGERQQW
ncbi:MAG: DUF6114 domain-containing protein [Haloarculaceae archaeon]